MHTHMQSTHYYTRTQTAGTKYAQKFTQRDVLARKKNGHKKQESTHVCMNIYLDCAAALMHTHACR
jgi:hypothetical protein